MEDAISTYETDIKKFEAKLTNFKEEFVDKFVSHHDMKKFLNQTSLCD